MTIEITNESHPVSRFRNMLDIIVSLKSGVPQGVTKSATSKEQSFVFDAELMREYQEYQRVNFDITVMIIMAVQGVIFYIGRCNIMHLLDDGIYFALAALSMSCALLLYLIYVFGFTIKYFCHEKKSILYRSSQYFLNSPRLIDLYKNVIAIAGTFGLTFGLIGRVMSGQCAANVTLWETQRCNPVASASSIPYDHALTLLVLPLVLQSALNGMSYRGTLVCWFISTISVMICLILVHGWLEAWTMLNFVTILVVIFKHEKQARMMFTHIKTTLAAEKEKMEHILLQQDAERNLSTEKAKHELEILAIKADEECRLMEKEQQQMVAMIGNIAHDLKTPLQSFLMDLESLKADEGFSQCKL